MKEALKKIQGQSTTEKMLNIQVQPENTCPMIDEAIGKFTNSEGTHSSKDVPSVYGCEHCSSGEQKELEEAINDIESVISDTSYLSFEEEHLDQTLRDLCSETRNLAQAIKSELWKCIDFLLDGNKNSFNPNKLKTLPLDSSSLVEAISLFNQQVENKANDRARSEGLQRLAGGGSIRSEGKWNSQSRNYVSCF